MNLLRNIIASCCVAIAIIASANPPDLPRTTLNGSEFYIYDVQKRETIYKIANQLGLRISDITDANPQALDGIRPGMRLYIPVDLYTDENATPTREKQSEAIITEPESTLKDTPTPEDELVLPEEENYESESLTPVADKSVDIIPPGMEIFTIKVKRGESLYGIARANNLSMDMITKLNPEAAYGVSPGDELKLLRPKSVENVPQLDDDNTRMAPIQYDYSLAEGERELSVPTLESDDNQFNYTATDTLSIAILLPFMLEQEEPTMQAKLFTEFYEGFLLAARKLNDSEANSHILIHTFDTHASIDTVNALMQLPEVFNANIIIAPDNDNHIAAIASKMSAETYLFNVFNIKSQLYLDYPNIIQANIPHTDMYSEAADALLNLYPDATPVFLSRIDGQADKDAFVSCLKEKLTNNSREFIDLSFVNLLTVKDLAQLQDTIGYVFVPISGQRAEFAKITEAIKRFSASRPYVTTALFGYPEWITFRGEYFNRLGENHATIYTRFYAAPNDAARLSLDEDFKEVYGVPMLDAAPVQGILGYDTGTYIINALRENGGDFRHNPGSYIGIQSAIEFMAKPEVSIQETPMPVNDYCDEYNDDSSPLDIDTTPAPSSVYELVNRAIFIVNFGPDGYIDKIPLL